MPRLTIIIGSLLVLLGVGFYTILAAIEHSAPSFTALIPTMVGIPILLLGFVAMKDSVRMHAMHGVAMLALLCLALPLGRLAMQLARGAEVKPTVLASLLLMAGLGGFLLVACIRSFIQARVLSTNNDE